MSQSQHIIIVDDEAPAREMVGDYLRMHGFTVTLCDGRVVPDEHTHAAEECGPPAEPSAVGLVDPIAGVIS